MYIGVLLETSLIDVIPLSSILILYISDSLYIFNSNLSRGGVKNKDHHPRRSIVFFSLSLKYIPKVYVYTTVSSLGCETRCIPGVRWTPRGPRPCRLSARWLLTFLEVIIHRGGGDEEEPVRPFFVAGLYLPVLFSSSKAFRAYQVYNIGIGIYNFGQLFEFFKRDILISTLCVYNRSHGFFKGIYIYIRDEMLFLVKIVYDDVGFLHNPHNQYIETYILRCACSEWTDVKYLQKTSGLQRTVKNCTILSWESCTVDSFVDSLFICWQMSKTYC